MPSLTSPRHAPVSLPRASMNCLKSSTLASTWVSSAPDGFADVFDEALRLVAHDQSHGACDSPSGSKRTVPAVVAPPTLRHEMRWSTRFHEVSVMNPSEIGKEDPIHLSEKDEIESLRDFDRRMRELRGPPIDEAEINRVTRDAGYANSSKEAVVATLVETSAHCHPSRSRNLARSTGKTRPHMYARGYPRTYSLITLLKAAMSKPPRISKR